MTMREERVMGKVIDLADENEKKMFTQFAQYIYTKYKRRNVFMYMEEKTETGFVTHFNVLDDKLAE